MAIAEVIKFEGPQDALAKCYDNYSQSLKSTKQNLMNTMHIMRESRTNLARFKK